MWRFSHDLVFNFLTSFHTLQILPDEKIKRIVYTTKYISSSAPLWRESLCGVTAKKSPSTVHLHSPSYLASSSDYPLNVAIRRNLAIPVYKTLGALLHLSSFYSLVFLGFPKTQKTTETLGGFVAFVVLPA